MNILLIYNEDHTVEDFKPLTAEIDVPVQTFPIKAAEGEKVKQEMQFFAFFSKSPLTGNLPSAPPTHVIILSALEPRWIDFLAGLSCGCQIPFLVYGKDAVGCIPEVYSFCFKLILSKEELNDYLTAEHNVHKMVTTKVSNPARETLLEMGIPINEKAMADCINEGKLKEVSLFLEAGFSPDTKDKNGVPMLNISARAGNLEILQLLLRAGAQLNLQAEDRNTTAILDATMGKHKKLVNALIEAGADVNILSKDGQSALIVAIGNGYDEITEMLSKAGADPDVKDSLGASARTYAKLFGKNAILALFDENAAKKTG